uniref:Uncharacterized protein n=1 Tax=Oryza meridionalis TaxID=40149 RepID=A0A0E0ETM7_9ORYZ
MECEVVVSTGPGHPSRTLILRVCPSGKPNRGGGGARRRRRVAGFHRAGIPRSQIGTLGVKNGGGAEPAGAGWYSVNGKNGGRRNGTSQSGTGNGHGNDTVPPPPPGSRYGGQKSGKNGQKKSDEPNAAASPPWQSAASRLAGRKLSALRLRKQALVARERRAMCCVDPRRPGTLQAAEELRTSVARHADRRSWPSRQSKPPAAGTSSLYTPFWSVVRSASRDSSSAMVEFTLKLHWISTLAPAQHPSPWWPLVK